MYKYKFFMTRVGFPSDIVIRGLKKYIKKPYILKLILQLPCAYSAAIYTYRLAKI